ncbi:hypothetical protein [Paraburkholderia sp. J41]|uniref:hypothetical protein n=1 Tax=Paraburkholderia sp. J41 TaxID=2805433 RepID=UPI002AC342C0|nr:hypothetical protein [Paraburkholderia sp. J41]
MARALLKRTLPGFAVFVLVWVAVFVWWHETRRLPTPRDIVGDLFALPAGLIVAYALVQRAIDGIRTAAAPLPRSQAQKAAPATMPHANASANADIAAPTAPARLQRASVMHATLRAAPASDAVSLLAALSAGARAPLDANLVDNAGFPVCAARVASVDDARLDALRAAWPASGAAATPDDDAQRAIALLEDTVIDALEPIAAALPAHRRASVWLDAIVPHDWNAALDASLAQYLQHRAAALYPRIQLHAATVRDARPAAAFVQLDLAITALDHAQRDAQAARWHVVAAAHSALSEAAVERADAEGRLFTSARQQGAVAGEAAAALVLRGIGPFTNSAGDESDDSDKSEADASPAPLAQITCSTAGSHAQHALDACLGPALANAQTEAAAVGTLIADGGAQSARAVELARFAGAHFPSLEPLADTFAPDAACGANGAAGTLLAVALAAQRVKDTQRAVFVATLAHAHERAALVVAPPDAARAQAAASADTTPSTPSIRT